MEHGSQIGTSFSAIKKTVFCMLFVPEIEEKKKPTNFCLSVQSLLHFFSPACGLISFLLFSLGVHLSYLSITAFKLD